MISSAETTMSGAAANGAIPKVEQNWNVNKPKKYGFHTHKMFSVKTESFFFTQKQCVTALAEEISARFLFPPSIRLFPAPLPAP